MSEIDPIDRAVTFPAAADRAFKHFVEDFGEWWPKEYSWSGDVLEGIAIEAQVGGHCYEIGPGAFHLDWGTVVVFERPTRLIFTWQINPDRTPQPDPARAGIVEVSFHAPDDHGGLCRVTLEHRGFERYGEDGAAYRAVLDGPEGWTYILASYAGYCT